MDKFFPRSVVFSVFFIVQVSTALATRVIGPWTRYYEGMEYAEGSDDSPRLQRVFALRISLQNPDVQIVTTPSAGSPPYETSLQTTPAFLDANSLECAVNANFFDTYGNYADLQGPFISNGTLISGGGSWADKLLVFHNDKTALLGQFGGNPVGWWSGVAGDVWTLVNGVTNDGWKHELDPRTAAGISQDGKYLLLLVVDGRQPGWSEGVYWSELAQWCKDFGAWNAIDLDGGGSSCIVLRSPVTDVANVMNRPSDGFPRGVGANLGISSAPVGAVGPSVCSMNSNRIDMVIRGNQNFIYLRTWLPGSGWSALNHIGSQITYDTPAIVSRADGILDVFARGTNDALYQSHYENGGWGSWVSLGGNLRSGPAACSMNSNNWEVVFRDTNDNVCSVSWNNGVYSHENLGGTTYDQPTIVSRTNGIKNIFIRGTNNALWYTTVSSVPPLSISSSGDGQVSLTWPDTATGVTLKYTDNLSASIQWTVVTNIPVNSAGQLVVTLSSANANRFFVLSRDDSFQPAWISLGGYLTSGPAATSRNPNNCEIVYRGASENLYYLAWDDGVWSSGNLSGSLACIPAITSLKTSNTIAVFLRDPDDNLLERQFDPSSGWSTNYTYLGTYY